MSFGIKVKEVRGEAIPSAGCIACSNPAVRSVGVIKLFHVYGLPLFPVGGRSLVACGNCGNAFDLKNAPADIKAQAKPTVTPKALLLSSWGLLVVVAIILGILYLGYTEKQEDHALVEAPQIGDIYVVRIADFIPTESAGTYPYGVLKITKVDNGKVTFAVANMVYGDTKSVRKSLPTDKNKKDFFTDEQIEAEKSALLQKLDSGSINDVQR